MLAKLIYVTKIKGSRVQAPIGKYLSLKDFRDYHLNFEHISQKKPQLDNRAHISNWAEMQNS